MPCSALSVLAIFAHDLVVTNTFSQYYMQTHRRATAVISKTLEALPAVSISVPLGFGLLSKPDLVQDVISPNSLANVHMMLAGLSDTSTIS